MIFSRQHNRETRKVHDPDLHKKRVMGFSCFFMDKTHNNF